MIFGVELLLSLGSSWVERVSFNREGDNPAEALAVEALGESSQTFLVGLHGSRPLVGLGPFFKVSPGLVEGQILPLLPD